MAPPAPPRWRRFWPSGIAAQLAVLVILAIIAIHALLTASFRLADRSVSPPGEVTGRLAAVIEILDRAPVDQRPGLLAAAAAGLPQLQLGLASASATLHEDTRDGPDVRHLGRALGPAFTVNALRPDGPQPATATTVAVRLRDLSFVIATLPRSPPPPAGPLMATVAFLVICAVLLGGWAVLALTRPLRRIAAAVEAYGPGQATPPLPEDGPREVRTVARAFNRMQERIARLLDDRTRALAAVSHDLRTPITRLRLRAEAIPDSSERARTIADLDQMGALVQSALAHLRDGQSDEAPTVVDLASLVQTVADQQADLGRDMPVTVSERLAVRGRLLELERAVTNLADNAGRYGRDPRIAVRREGDAALVEIIDQGPGIPRERRAELLEPFVRGDAARTMNDQDGFGLGLTIARTVAEAHGGALELADGIDGVFIARLRLPLP
ncbi:MAG: HAMP domain-containing protein [Proteobacteria bacterium]|nr:HAMP domain-containing protein [Pseudomonadota bacterium]